MAPTRGALGLAITGIKLLLLVYFVLRFMLFDSREDIGSAYVVLGGLALVGQVPPADVCRLEARLFLEVEGTESADRRILGSLRSWERTCI